MTRLTTSMPTSVQRRAFLAGLSATGALGLSACAGPFGGFSFTDAVARLLFLSSDRAFQRMLQPGGFWDDQVAQLGFDAFLGSRGSVLARILTSTLFKDRLADAFGDIAYEGAERAAPLVADTIRVVGFQNAIDLVRGGPTAATSFLRQEMGGRLVEAMVPEIGGALRVARDPLVGEALAALSGVDIPQVANSFSARVDDVIWREIGVEEAAIRANPRATGDPLIIGVFGAGNAL